MEDSIQRVVGGRLYDTGTAWCIGASVSCSSDGLRHTYEALYLKNNCEFFLVSTAPQHLASSGHPDHGLAIVPLVLSTAQDWIWEHLGADDYSFFFGEPVE